jgi:hypothetical protein
MKEALGPGVGMALDCGPGLVPSDLLRLAQVRRRCACARPRTRMRGEQLIRDP